MWKAKLYAIYWIASFPSPYLRLIYLRQCTLDRKLIFTPFPDWLRLWHHWYGNSVTNSGNSERRMLSLFELFGAVFLFITVFPHLFFSTTPLALSCLSVCNSSTRWSYPQQRTCMAMRCLHEFNLYMKNYRSATHA